jgi:hypothetical protein
MNRHRKDWLDRASKIEMSNIPIYNLRHEFEEHLQCFRAPSFKELVFNCGAHPIRLKHFDWHGLPNDLLTMMLFRSISGLESYLGAAVDYELHRRGKMSEEARQALENPFLLHRIAVFALFDRLPSLVDPAIVLSVADRELFETARTFYSEVRNPIFHGNQVSFSGDNFDSVAAGFELLAALYDWIDTWYSAFLGGWQELRLRA